MQPTLTDVHVNVPMTQLSLLYAQEAKNFVARRVFPSIPVTKASDRYYVYSRADLNRNTMRRRAPSTESAGVGWRLDNTPSYSVDVWALHQDIDTQVRANADAAVNLDMQTTRMLTMQSLINREVDWATNFFTTGLWTGLVTGVASAPGANQVLQWNDPNSNPIQDVRNAIRAQQLVSGGFRANKAVIGRPAVDVLKDHPDFVDRIKYGQTAGGIAIIDMSEVAAVWELDEVLVMDAVVNVAGEQAGPDSGGAGGFAGINAAELNQFVGSAQGKAMLLTYTPPSPGLMVPGCGYSFDWTGYLGANANGERLASFDMWWIKSTRFEIESAYQHKIVGADMGTYFSNIVA